jgi:hypothetical protein
MVGRTRRRRSLGVKWAPSVALPGRERARGGAKAGSTSFQLVRDASRIRSSSFLPSGSAVGFAKRPPLNCLIRPALNSLPPVLMTSQSDSTSAGNEAGSGIQRFSSDSVNSLAGSSPTSSANIVKMHRMRNLAIASPPWCAASRLRASSARWAAMSRVTWALRLAGSSRCGLVKIARSSSACAGRSARKIRWRWASGKSR